MWQVLGQDRAVKLLQGSLEGDRLCHAYLFVGPKQVGKGTLALDLARALNCTGDAPPCGQCPQCTRIGSGVHPDVQVIGLVAEHGKPPRTEIGIDQIKDLQRSASLPPFEGRHKAFIVDGAERMSTEAANCLLKTLEEPPPKVVLVLLTSREDLLLPTVLSRCFRVELRPMSAAAVETALVSRGVTSERARLLARLCGGRLGWALQAAGDEALLGRRQDKLEEIVALVSSGDEQLFAYAARLATQSREAVREALAMWLNWCRDMLLVKGGCPAAVTNVDYEDRLAAQARACGLSRIKDIINGIQVAQEQLDLNASPRLALEVMMLTIRGKVSPAVAGA